MRCNALAAIRGITVRDGAAVFTSMHCRRRGHRRRGGGCGWPAIGHSPHPLATGAHTCRCSRLSTAHRRASELDAARTRQYFGNKHHVLCEVPLVDNVASQVNQVLRSPCVESTGGLSLTNFTWPVLRCSRDTASRACSPAGGTRSRVRARERCSAG